MVRTGAALSKVRAVVNLRTESVLVPNTRLPLDFIPYKYNLDLVAILEDEYKIEGSVTIQVCRMSHVYINFSICIEWAGIHALQVILFLTLIQIIPMHIICISF